MNDNSNKTGPLIVSGRRDGLGGRIASLLNVIRLAERLDSPYAFIWPGMPGHDRSFHGVNSSEEIFDAAYAKTHLLKELMVENYVEVKERRISKPDIARATDPKSSGLISHHWGPGLVQFEDESSDENLGDYFHRIKWSASITQLIVQIEALSLSDFAAVHIRHGDIVYGTNRFDLYTKKYTPTAIVRSIIQDIRSKGQRVLMLSDDSEFLQEIRRDYSISLVSDLIDTKVLSNSERAFADMFMMARCSVIFGQESAFSVSSAMIGNIAHENSIEAFNTEDLPKAVMDDWENRSAEANPLLAAKDFFYVSQLEGQSSEKKAQLLQLALQFDPKNYTYCEMYVVELLRQGRTDEANTFIRQQSWNFFRESRLDASTLFPKNRWHANHALSIVEQATQATQATATPYVHAYHAFLLRKNKQLILAKESATVAYESRNCCLLLATQLVNILWEANEFAHVESVFSELGERYKTVPALHSIRAELYSSSKEPKNAALEFEEAYRLAPSNHQYAIKAASCYFRAGEEAQGEALRSTAKKEAPLDPTISYWESKIEERRKNPEAAIDAMLKAHHLRPDKKNYRDRLALLREKFASTRVGADT